MHSEGHVKVYRDSGNPSQNVYHGTLEVTPPRWEIPDNPMMDVRDTSIILHFCRGNVLEIGTHRGVTTGCMARKAEKVVSVDVLSVPSTTIKGHEGCVLPKEEVGSMIPQDVRDRVSLHLIDPEDKTALKRVLLEEGLLYDLILIDGDHSWEGVWHDYETCAPFLSETGVMLFHDCWWQVIHPEMGPMTILRRLGGVILNKTILGMPRSHADTVEGLVIESSE